MGLIIYHTNNPLYFTDTHYSIKCPHCGVKSGLLAISIPQYELLIRYKPRRIGIGYTCASCNEPVFLKFPVQSYKISRNRVFLHETFEEVEKAKIEYEFQYLPEPVSNDFQEACTCYSNNCFNAFGAMCRRTVQSASSCLGAKGKDRVTKQIQELGKTIDIDKETLEALEAIVIAGHDGAHPHLPPLEAERADILLALMKDILHQLFIRKQKIIEATTKRQKKIEEQKKSEDKDTK